MIRHIATSRFREGVAQEDVDAFIAAVLALEIDGMVSMTTGPNLGFRSQDVDFGLVADFEDEAAFRRYDTDPEHVELRAGLAAKLIAEAHAVQIEI